MVFNGKNFNNHQMLGEFLTKAVPGCRHKINSLNIQPLGLSPGTERPPVLISVNGRIEFLGEEEIGFSQTFILETDDQFNYYILNDIFRCNDSIPIPRD